MRAKQMGWKRALVLGSIALIVVPTIIILNLDRLHLIVEALEKLSNGR